MERMRIIYPGLENNPFFTPAMRAIVTRVMLARRQAVLERRASRAPRIRDKMGPDALARVRQARQRLGPTLLRERNRKAKARERQRRLAEDPEGYRRGRREEMRAWRAGAACRNLAQCRPGAQRNG